MNIEAIVTDIEGTTTDISFVHKVLFPYAEKALPEFLRANQYAPEIAAIIEDVRIELGEKDASINTVIDALLTWIKEDKKTTPLKSLQGYIWKTGYENGDFTGHVYTDASFCLNQWQSSGLKLFVYSSGSTQAQKLLYQYSDAGDLTPLFSDYFDTRIGGKKESQSYTKILKSLQLPGDKVLFLSDVEEELDAAQKAGMHTILIKRENEAFPPVQTSHIVATQFTEINSYLRRAMTHLSIYKDSDASTPFYTTEDPQLIGRKLAQIGVSYRRWTSNNPLSDNASNEDILKTYELEINALIAEADYRSVEVISLNENSTNKVAMREKFLSEHTHSDDEVRFFVRGQGQFYLHAEDKVYVIRC
ncbi:MAG: acireductone synthase, partial [Pseudomonadales bacterium]|nr:acireductone synthase [Pseudomonadales bacterium]